MARREGEKGLLYDVLVISDDAALFCLPEKCFIFLSWTFFVYKAAPHFLLALPGFAISPGNSSMGSLENLLLFRASGSLFSQLFGTETLRKVKRGHPWLTSATRVWP